ncbi:MAG TPA: LLM class flavin-dependent oxidoreductase [Micromonospora sp.]
MAKPLQVGIAYLGSPADAGPLAKEAEEAGADAFTVGETEHSAFGGAVAAVLATRRIVVGTNISIAFARSPMVAAIEAYSLMALGPGRTFYGLGSQIRQVIERRFSAQFSPPVPRMEEYVEVMRRAFASRRGEEVEPFRGKYYTVSQFSFFGPPEPELEKESIHLGAVGPKMTALAARRFDGMLGHGVLTPGYIKEKVRPVIKDLFLTSAAMTSVDEDVAAARERARWALAFYASTPAYEPALAFEGYPDLPARLRVALREQTREDAARLVSDEVLDRFVLIGRPMDVAEKLARYEGIVDRVMLGGIGVGATRAEIVSNNRGLIEVVRCRRALTGQGN